MEYIAITLLAISATTCIIYLLANKVFGVRLRLRSLVMCAACALFISLVLPRIVVSFAGLAGTVGFLAVFAIIFAYFVAYYDDPEFHNAANACPAVALGGETVAQEPMEMREAAVILAEAVDVVSSEVTAPVTESGNNQALPAAELPDESCSNSEDYPSDAVEIIEPDEMEPAAADPLLVFSQDAITEDEPADDAIEEPIISESQAQIAATAEDENEVVSDLTQNDEIVLVDEECSDEAEVDGNSIDAGTSELASVILALESPEDYEPLEEELFPMDDGLVENELPGLTANSNTSSREKGDDENYDELIDPRTLFSQVGLGGVSNEEGEEEEPVPPADSLDSLLDYAFAQKEKCNYQRSLEAFRRALKLYRDSEAAPYLAIEIATLLKDRGSYDEAINVLSDGRGLPGLNQQHPLDQEFIETIAYLRIVKNTLLHHRLGFVPFHRIPAAIAKEIDAEFREWRNLA